MYIIMMTTHVFDDGQCAIGWLMAVCVHVCAVVCVRALHYLVWKAEGLREFANLTQCIQILVQSTNHLLDILLVCCLGGV
jgi:hypothetical protein